jgi:general secretion pathway protein D
MSLRRASALLLGTMLPAGMCGQNAAPPAAGVASSAASTQQATNAPQATGTQQIKAAADTPKPSPAVIETGKPIQADSLRAQRKAAKLYLQGVHELEKERAESAWNLLKQAAELEPTNVTYVRAAELARQSAVTHLVQQASRERGQGPNNESANLLKHALEIDPKNPLVLQHTDELGNLGTPVGATASSTIKTEAPIASDPIQLEASKEKHSFHARGNARQVVQDVFRAYGIEVSVHDSVQNKLVRLDLDDVSFAQATHVLGMVTNTFWEALDPHRALVAQDTRENRTQFQRVQMETVYLPGLTDKELTDVSNLARNVFDAQQAVPQPSARTLTLRASARAMDAFNRTVARLEDGKNQVDLNVKIIELAYVSSRETGVKFFQQTSLYNVPSEINSILTQNQALVQQIISAGLVANQNTLANQIAILAILVASGQLTGTPFNQGFIPFGGGLAQSILTTSPATLTMSLNSSDTRTLDDIHMRLQDDEAGTFKIGERYPITTSSFSSVALPAVAGISSAAAAAAEQTIPQIQYEDLGLTFKATPKVMRSDDVALNVDLKMDSLGGSALNDIPILNNQQFTGVLTLRAGETAVLLSDISQQVSRALNGMPGISDIPGLEDISDIKRDRNVARLLILVTPNVVRDEKQSRHGPMLMVDKSANAH